MSAYKKNINKILESNGCKAEITTSWVRSLLTIKVSITIIVPQSVTAELCLVCATSAYIDTDSVINDQTFVFVILAIFTHSHNNMLFIGVRDRLRLDREQNISFLIFNITSNQHY